MKQYFCKLAAAHLYGSTSCIQINKGGLGAFAISWNKVRDLLQIPYLPLRLIFKMRAEAERVEMGGKNFS